MICRLRAIRADPERGSTIPLILGLFLIGVYFVAGSIALSDVFTKQRDLQSICDGAAIAAANSVSFGDVFTGASDDALPLSDPGSAVDAYLARDPERKSVRTYGQITPDGTTIELRCLQHNRIAFGALLLKPRGVDQTVAAAARSPVGS